jgi:predicted aspartyl protease
MFLDTAASRTILTPRAIERLDLEVSDTDVVIAGSRRTTAGSARLSSFQISRFAETRVDDLPVHVMALPFVDGAIGLNYLAQFRRLCYDFDTNLLELTPR